MQPHQNNPQQNKSKKKKKPSWLVWRLTIRRDLTNMELLPEGQGFVPRIMHPDPWDLQQRHEPPKTFGLEN